GAPAGLAEPNISLWICSALLPALASSTICFSFLGLVGQLGSVFTQLAYEPRPHPQSQVLSFITFITAYFCASDISVKVPAGMSADFTVKEDSSAGRAAAPPATGALGEDPPLTTLPAANPTTSPTRRATITFGFMWTKLPRILALRNNSE